MWKWPIKGVAVEVPTGLHAGAFGAIRRYDKHTGVDLYCPEGQAVTAVEGGRVVAIIDFTGPEAGSPWWNTTQAVLVDGASGVVLYGEILPSVTVGSVVMAGDTIGRVQRVLKKDKGLPTTMLHLELYDHGTKDAVWWRLGEPKPENLRDPTSHLLKSVS